MTTEVLTVAAVLARLQKISDEHHDTVTLILVRMDWYNLFHSVFWHAGTFYRLYDRSAHSD